MRKAAVFMMVFALALFAMPAMATHPNYIDFVMVTDVTAQEEPLTFDARYPAYMLTNNYGPSYAGMYPPEWGGEGVGQAGSQTGAHYVWHPMGGTRGHWVSMRKPTASAPVVVEFDLRAIQKVRQIAVWNLGTYVNPTWWHGGSRLVTIKYRKAPWDEWSTFGDVEFAPAGALRQYAPNPSNAPAFYSTITRSTGAGPHTDTSPWGEDDYLIFGWNSNAWGTLPVSNKITSSNPEAMITSQVWDGTTQITGGSVFETYWHPKGGSARSGGLGANRDPIPVNFEGRFVRFEIKSNWGPDINYVGLGEVRFYKDGPGLFIDTDPNPNYSGSYVHPGNNLGFGAGYRGWVKPKSVLVYNLGLSEAEVTGATVEGPFGLGGTLPVTFPASVGSIYPSLNLTATFSPADIGYQTGKIHIEYNTAAGNFIQTLNVTGTGKDVAFGYIPYAVADATQYGNPWWGGWTAQHAVDGVKTLYNSGGAPAMIEDLGEFVFGSKNAKLIANTYDTYRTQDYPNYSGVPTVEGVTFAVDLGGASPMGQVIGSQKAAAASTHRVSEVRIWNYNQVIGDACTAAIRSVKFEYSSDVDAATWRTATGWTQWMPEGDSGDFFEMAQPTPGIDSPPTDILDTSNIASPIRFWRFTTVGLAEGAPGANYGHANMIGLGQIRFYTSKANLAVVPVGNDFGNKAPYQSTDSPSITIENLGSGEVIIESIAWAGDRGPFTATIPGTYPQALASGGKIEGLMVNYTPKNYGTFTANLSMLVTDNSNPAAEDKPQNIVTMVFKGSCLAVENGFIPVNHAWASSSWDGGWTPNWTHAANGLAVQEVPAGVWGSRGMLHSGNVAGSNFQWHARQSGYPEPSANWIAWDLGSPKTIYDMLIWNSMRSCCDGSMRGFRRVKVQYTNDAPPTVSGGSEWGPWGGAAIPIDYMVAWDGLNWLELPVATLAHYPVASLSNPINWNTPNGYLPASNQLNGQPIQFQGRTARMVRLAADSATWADYYMNNQQEGWYNTPQSYQYCLAEARFYGPASDAIYDVTTHDFGSVEVGSSASVDVTVTNRQAATADLVIQNLIVEDRAETGVASPYTIAPKAGGSTPITIAKGQSAVFTVTFAPTTAGDYNTFESVILNNSSLNGLMLTALTGTAYVPGNSDILLPETSVDFGQRFLQLGTQRAPFTIKNMGDTALTVDFAFDPSNVFGTTQAGTLTVGAFDEAVVWVTVTPQALGTTNGIMTLTTNSPDEGTVEVPLTVTVANAAAASVDGSSWMLYE